MNAYSTANRDSSVCIEKASSMLAVRFSLSTMSHSMFSFFLVDSRRRGRVLTTAFIYERNRKSAQYSSTCVRSLNGMECCLRRISLYDVSSSFVSIIPLSVIRHKPFFGFPCNWSVPRWNCNLEFCFERSADACREGCLILLALFGVTVAERERDMNDLAYQSCGLLSVSRGFPLASFGQRGFDIKAFGMVNSHLLPVALQLLADHFILQRILRVEVRRTGQLRTRFAWYAYDGSVINSEIFRLFLMDFDVCDRCT